jgi:hypothetical protein
MPLPEIRVLEKLRANLQLNGLVHLSTYTPLALPMSRKGQFRAT